MNYVFTSMLKIFSKRKNIILSVWLSFDALSKLDFALKLMLLAEDVLPNSLIKIVNC